MQLKALKNHREKEQGLHTDDSNGYRESKDSWQSLIRDLKRRGLNAGPSVAVGDGALGFWAAISEEYSSTRHQRCWVHKTVNVLDKMPKSMHAKAKSMLHEIWMAEDKKKLIYP